MWHKPNISWRSKNYKVLTLDGSFADFTVRCWCFGPWAPSSASPSRCADRPLWSETSAGPASAAGYPAGRARGQHCGAVSHRTGPHKSAGWAWLYHCELIDLLSQSRALVLHGDVLVLLLYLVETHAEPHECSQCWFIHPPAPRQLSRTVFSTFTEATVLFWGSDGPNGSFLSYLFKKMKKKKT